MKNKLATLSVLLIIYLLLKYFIPYWNYIVYPITLLVTFLHEFGHSFFAIITWWAVDSIQINSDGSWYATTAGWIRSIILMWWYIWSAIFWNLLLYVGAKSDKYSELIIYVISGLMIFTSIFWFNSFLTSIILLLIAWFLIFLAKKVQYDSIILQFLWISSLLYIIQDFNVWPSSDLSKFSEIFIVLPQVFWMYMWLIIVLIITWINLRIIFKK